MTSILKKNNSNNKIYAKKIAIPIITFITFACSNAYYFYNYYITQDLSFSGEDKFLFLFNLSTFLIFTVVSVFSLIDKTKLLEIVFILKKEIEDAEENCILVNRDTQELVLNYFDKNKEDHD